MKNALSAYVKAPLILRIVIGLIIGVCLGVWVPQAAAVSVFGNIFVGALKGVAPILVFVLVTASLASAGSGLGSRFRTVITFYMVSTFLSAAVAVIGSFIFPITIPLADAVIMVATAPKSASGHDAINAAMADVEAGKTGRIPRQLQNKHYDGADNPDKGQHYRYPHDYPNHYTPQQYLPDAVRDSVYYHFGDNKNEQAFKAYWDNIKPRR